MGSRFAGCVFAGTPSLLMVLMQLLVGIEVGVLAAGALLREPRIEAGGNQAVRPLLLHGGAHRHKIRVFILYVLVVTAHPSPADDLIRRHHGELLPEAGVLERPGFPTPTPRPH